MTFQKEKFLHLTIEKALTTNKRFGVVKLRNRQTINDLQTEKNPKVIIESSFLVTTSSGQGNKSKTEGNIKLLIEKYYPKAKFVGFVDGIGWYVRKGDLMRMVTAYDEVFTFHQSELKRFVKFIKVATK